MDVAHFNINFNLQSFKGTRCVIPFKIVVQSSSKKLEKSVMQQWPDLMKEGNYTLEQKKQLNYMKVYIKKHLSTRDINNIHNYFYERHWIEPLNPRDGWTKIKITDYDAKMWVDGEAPYLELHGTLFFDIADLLKLYSKKRYIKFSLDKQFIRRDVEMKFLKPFPLILNYNRSVTTKNIILDYLKKEFRTRNSTYLKALEQYTKLNKLYDYTKEVRWKDRTTIRIDINDFGRLLGKKISQHKGLVVFGGLYLAKKLAKYVEDKDESKRIS